MTFARPSPAELQQRRAAEREASVRALTATRGRPAVMGGGTRAAAPKPETYQNPRWLAAVRKLGKCVLCGADGVQAAHRNQGKGMGLKADDCACAALCPRCHTEIDQGRDMTREQRRATIDRAIVLTVMAMVRENLLEVR